LWLANTLFFKEKGGFRPAFLHFMPGIWLNDSKKGLVEMATKPTNTAPQSLASSFASAFTSMFRGKGAATAFNLSAGVAPAKVRTPDWNSFHHS